MYIHVKKDSFYFGRKTHLIRSEISAGWMDVVVELPKKNCRKQNSLIDERHNELST